MKRAGSPFPSGKGLGGLCQRLVVTCVPKPQGVVPVVVVVIMARNIGIGRSVAEPARRVTVRVNTSRGLRGCGDKRAGRARGGLP